MFENKILVLDKQFQSFIHQIETIDLMSPQERLQNKERLKKSATAQKEIFVEYFEAILKDLDSLETLDTNQKTVEAQDQQVTPLETTVAPPTQNKIKIEAKKSSQSVESEMKVSLQTASDQEVVSEISINYNLEAEQQLVNEYNTILHQYGDNYKREQMINQQWSKRRMERMFMPNTENVKASNSLPELKSGETGNFYGIPQDNYYFIFPIPSVNVTSEVIQYAFNVEEDGKYMSSIAEAAKFEKQGEIVRLVGKGKIKAESQ